MSICRRKRCTHAGRFRGSLLVGICDFLLVAQEPSACHPAKDQALSLVDQIADICLQNGRCVEHLGRLNVQAFRAAGRGCRVPGALLILGTCRLRDFTFPVTCCTLKLLLFPDLKAACNNCPFFAIGTVSFWEVSDGK